MSEEKKEAFDQEGESGISIRDIFRIIGKKIWYVLAATLAVTLAAVLVFMFAINPMSETQSMSFTINYPMSDGGKYPDGSIFNYRDIVSRGVIEAAKGNEEFKEEFASIDVDKVLKKEGITISAEPVPEYGESYYIFTVSLKSTCFSGVEAEDFINALGEAFISFVEQKAESLSYNIDKNTFENASFKDQLRILDEQKEILIAQYDLWIKEYNAGHIVQGKPLVNHRRDVETAFADDVRTPIENRLSAKGYEYFNDNVTGDDVKDRVEQLRDEQLLNQEIIENLKVTMRGDSGSSVQSEAYSADRTYRIAAYASADTSDQQTDKNQIIIMPNESDLSSKLAYYTERNAIVTQQIKNLTKDVTGDDYSEIVKEIKKFGTDLLTQFNILNNRADTLKSVITAIYQRDTLLTFNSRRVTSEGGTNLVIVAVGVLVVSFLVFAVIAFFVGKKKTVKKSEPVPEAENNKKE